MSKSRNKKNAIKKGKVERNSSLEESVSDPITANISEKGMSNPNIVKGSDLISQENMEVDQRREEESSEIEEETSELLAFRLAEEEFAVDLLKVKEIIRLLEITSVPRVGETFDGIIALRGSIIPVFNLCASIGLQKASPGRKTRIIVLALEMGWVGFVVDEVTDVVRLPASAIEPPHSMLGGSDSDHILGVGRVGDRMIILLDIEKLVTQKVSL